MESTISNLRLPLLITGVAGVAGYNAFHYFRKRFPGQVIGLRPHQTFRLNGDGIVAMDADDADGMRDLFREVRFRSVLNCVGNCALKSCELDKEMARRLNVVTAEVLVENVRELGARLVHLSSDLVFSGRPRRLEDSSAGLLGNYVETDGTDPVTIYGKTMVLAEQIISDSVRDAAILRISLPMGPSFNEHAGAIDWINSRFRHGRPATLYFDEVRSAAYCDDLNHVFERMLHNDAAGLYHCGGPRPITLYQIGQIVNRVGGYAPHLLHGCPRIESGPIPPRAGNVSMNSTKLAELLGFQPFQPWPAEPDWVPTDRHWHRERAPSEIGSHQLIRELLYANHQSRARSPAQ
ncbi:MAG TPA: sugar nucleotide-binding protein [Gemmataceae bacterium]|nr:sugar nucleotide-binding protein [Gemmataceae bacterium]